MNFKNWLMQLNMDFLLEYVISAAAGLICITVHEVSHGYAAYLLGDPTAKRAGRLSLNPLRHIDIVGLLCVALVHFGWAKAVPINPRNFRHLRRDTALTAIAGPLANVLLLVLSLILYGAAATYMTPGPEWLYWVLHFASDMILINASLAVFNLIPFPPLDGSKILLALLPQSAYRFVLRYERYGFVVLAVVLYTGVLSGPLHTLSSGLIDLLWPIARWTYELLFYLA